MDSTTIVDLSHKLDSNVQIYPGDPPFACKPWATIPKDGFSVHSLALGSHTGTHVDAPSHFFADGETVDHIPISSLFGPLVVIDLTHKSLEDRQKITWKDIKNHADHIRPGVIIVLRTGWSKYWGTPRYYEHPFFARDVAEEIMRRGGRVLGVDTLNPDETPYQGVGGADGFGVHEVILGGGGYIAENLTNLASLDRQDHIALVPLNLEGNDGSPVRAFAWKS